MRRFVLLSVLLFCSASIFAQKKVSVLGDSYSTFKGYIPEVNAIFYPNPACGVEDVNQTWWMQFINSNGYVLEKNDSWSGSTICNTGYGKEDYSDRSFFSRVNKLGNPDILFVFGCTNDDWAHSPIGDYKYKNWSRKDLYNYRPALAYLLSELKMLYPNTDIYFLLNSDTSQEIVASTRVICKKYKLPLIELHDIDKQIGHPTATGMKAISDQINQFIGL